MNAAKAPATGQDNATPPIVPVLILAGMVLRLAWALLIPVEPVSDALAYHVYATNLVEHGVYGLAPDEPGAYWPVGTAAAAAATYLLLGESFAGVVALNLIAGGVIMIMVFKLGLHWFGRDAAVMATALVAFWPNLIFFTSILSSELFFIMLVLLGLWLWEKRGQGWWPLLLGGLVWGLACYVRPVALLLPVALVFAALPSGAVATFHRAGRAVAVIAIMLAVLSPWTMRNYQLFGEPVLVSTNFGPNLWMGNNPDSRGEYMPLPDWVADMSETERASALGAVAREHILSDLPGFALASLVKAVRLYDRETIGVVWNEAAIERIAGTGGVQAAKLVATGYWYALLLLALWGVWRVAGLTGWRVFFHPAVLALLYFTALHAVTVVQDRYHMPVSGFVAVLAGLGLADARRRWQGRGGGQGAAP